MNAMLVQIADGVWVDPLKVYVIESPLTDGPKNAYRIVFDSPKIGKLLVRATTPDEGVRLIDQIQSIQSQSREWK